MGQILAEDLDFLAHHGVKGMKWGVRRTRRLQKRLDRTKRIQEGTASKRDRLVTAAVQGVYTKKGAKRVLMRGARQQAKILEGKKKVSNILLRANGIRVKELDYGQGDPKKLPPMSKKAKAGQAAATAGLIAYGAIIVGKTVSKGR